MPIFFSDPTNESNERSIPIIEIHNIGKNVAKNIIVTWTFDASEVAERIKNVYPVSSIPAEAEIFRFVPAGKSCRICLPENYINCCGPQVNKIDLESERLKKPVLKLCIEYDNLYRTERVKRTFKTETVFDQGVFSLSFPILEFEEVTQLNAEG